MRSNRTLRPDQQHEPRKQEMPACVVNHVDLTSIITGLERAQRQIQLKDASFAVENIQFRQLIVTSAEQQSPNSPAKTRVALENTSASASPERDLQHGAGPGQSRQSQPPFQSSIRRTRLSTQQSLPQRSQSVGSAFVYTPTVFGSHPYEQPLQKRALHRPISFDVLRLAFAIPRCRAGVSARSMTEPSRPISRYRKQSTR